MEKRLSLDLKKMLELLGPCTSILLTFFLIMNKCCSGLIKRKGYFSYLGLKGSGKSSLIKVLQEESLVDIIPPSHTMCHEKGFGSNGEC